MMHSNLKQTSFNIEKLKNAVNVGSCSAYQIYTSPGPRLGRIGMIVDPATLIAANESDFTLKTTADALENAATSWFGKALASLKR